MKKIYGNLKKSWKFPEIEKKIMVLFGKKIVENLQKMMDHFLIKIRKFYQIQKIYFLFLFDKIKKFFEISRNDG